MTDHPSIDSKDHPFTVIDGGGEGMDLSWLASEPERYEGLTLMFTPDGKTIVDADYELLASLEFSTLLDIQGLALMRLIPVTHMYTRTEAVDALRQGLIEIDELTPTRTRMLNWLKTQGDESESPNLLEDWVRPWWRHLTA